MLKRKAKNWLKSKKFAIFLVALISTLVLDIVLVQVGDIHASANAGIMKGLPLISATPTYFYVQMNVSGPSYFFPVGEVGASFSNPYANEISNFTVKMSLDNSTWVNVPFSSTPKIVDLGQAQLNGFYVRVYVVLYFPPQSGYGTVPANVVVKAFNLHVYVDAPYTPQTWLLLILLFIALFSFIIQITDFFFKEKKKVICPHCRSSIEV